MPALFDQSETKLNLMRAFAGESQARNRYSFSAAQAKKQDLYVIEQAFTFTANQEHAHAKVYYDFLSQLGGQSIAVDGTYPVDIFPDLLQHLKAAQHNEYQEWEDAYPSFAKIAQEEGFPQIAAAFSQIALVEQTHGDRFGKLADLLESGNLFVSDSPCKWMCLNCGHVAEGTNAPAVCPVCKHPQGYFLRWEMTCYQ